MWTDLCGGPRWRSLRRGLSNCGAPQEFYVQATHPSVRDVVSHDFAVRLIEKLQRFRIQDNTVSVLQSAFELKERFHTPSYEDAAILAAAKTDRAPATPQRGPEPR